VRKILPPPDFDSRTVQAVASRCNDYAIPVYDSIVKRTQIKAVLTIVTDVIIIIIVKGLEVHERMICEITEVKEMVVVTGATGSMWEPLAKHLDDISVTFSCGNTANGWFV
jgi:hypothetical protein